MPRPEYWLAVDMAGNLLDIASLIVEGTILTLQKEKEKPKPKEGDTKK